MILQEKRAEHIARMGAHLGMRSANQTQRLCAAGIAEVAGRVSTEQREGQSLSQFVPELLEELGADKIVLRGEQIDHLSIDSKGSSGSRQPRDEPSYRIQKQRAMDEPVAHQAVQGGSRIAHH